MLQPRQETAARVERGRSNRSARLLPSGSAPRWRPSGALVGLLLPVFSISTESPAAAAPLLAAAGDIACDPRSRHFNGGKGERRNCRQLATSRLLRRADRVLALGDNQYQHGSLRNFRRSYDRSWGRYRSKTRPAIGNHEYGPPESPNLGARGYWDYFGSPRAGRRNRGWYSFNLGGWHLVVLNSHCRGSSKPTYMQPKVGCAEGSRQMRWLKRDLSAHRDRSCMLAAWHHPRFASKGGGWREVRPFWQALQEADADVVLSGHNHVYERFARRLAGGSPSPTGIRQYIVGTGGKSLAGPFRHPSRHSQKRLRRFGVLKLRLRSDSYRWKFTGTGRRVLDQGTTACGGSA
jgi:hypothetical protein